MSATDLIFLTADWSDPPPCGTACALCFGHFCPAKGYLGSIPICSACGAGRTCGQASAIEELHATHDGQEEARPADTRRRCLDCRGLLGEQCRGPLCWTCKRRQEGTAQREAERAASGRERYARGDT